MAGHGRPPVDEPRIKKITFRVTDDEFDQIELYAKKYHLTKSQVLLKAYELMKKAEEEQKA